MQELEEIFTYYDDNLCVYTKWLTSSIISKSYYDKLAREKDFEIKRRGARNSPALVLYESLRPEHRKKIEFIIGGSPYELYKGVWFEKYIQTDVQAKEFFNSYYLGNGMPLDAKYAKLYTTQAEILNGLNVLKIEKRGRGRKVMMSNEEFNFWERASKIINKLQEKYKHNLPAVPNSLRNKFSKYQKNGYESLITGKFLNKNGKKVDEKIESLIMSLFDHNSKPYLSWVSEWFREFMQGEREIVNYETGEIYNREDFKDSRGNYIWLSDTTISRYLKKIENKISLEKKRNDSLYYDTVHRPHRMMHAPNYSLSIVSMDDSDAQASLVDGVHPKIYMAYDVKSNAIIGWAVSRDKNSALFIDMLYNMFRNLKKWGMGMPLEIQAEHHLVNKKKYELENLFPFVTFANPGVAREKYAEPMNRVFKYSVQKMEYPVGRHYAKYEANRVKEKKYWDESGMQIKEKKFGMKEFRKLLEKMVNDFNNTKHSTIEGMTRLEVLKNYQNPKIQNLPEHTISRMIGYKESVNIRNNQFINVRKVQYWLESPELLKRLESNNYKVDAYYTLNEKDSTNDVFLFQGEKYIGRAEYLPTYNRAKAERTEEDFKAMLLQEEYLKKFSDFEKDNRKKIQKTGTIKLTKEIKDAISAEPEIIVNENTDESFDELLNRALERAETAKDYAKDSI